MREAVAEFSPMMRQYLDIKNEYKDCLLFFRLGDFYEMFFDDAKIASEELELTLTGRECGQEERAPMCGVPHHSCDAYIARLIKKGYKVAICEQTEDPASAKGIVRREVTRIVTPGTVTDYNMLDENKNNYIASVYLKGTSAGIAFADVSTGELFAVSFQEDGEVSQKVINELGKFTPGEIIENEDAALSQTITDFVKKRLGCTDNVFENEYFDSENSVGALEEYFGTDSSDNVFGVYKSKTALFAVSGLIAYLKSNHLTNLKNIENIDFYEEDVYLGLDLSARRNLEITQTMMRGDKVGSLLWVLDDTKTSAGARLLRQFLEQPLLNLALIKKRLSAVAALKQNSPQRNEIREAMRGVFDIERIMSKLIYGSANGRDLRTLSASLKQMPIIKKNLSLSCRYLDEIAERMEDMKELYTLIENAIDENPPVSLREGGFIKKGYNEEVDRLRDILTNGKKYITDLETKEKEATGIKNLKIGYNKVFGYYIEVTKSYLSLVPEYYIRKQTLSNCERYITSELKDYENTVLNAREKINSVEYDLFTELKTIIAGETHRIQNCAKAAALIDVFQSLASVAARNNYSEPEVDYSDRIEIKDGRHAVVEEMGSDNLFVPNDAVLDCNENRVMLITGPNMAGKSTYMRQVALIVLMAQIGSFVPAASARIGVVDKIFTRVGASDDLSAGQSTFMVEMSEVASILKNSTSKSLIIFDEIGRGTSTFDGLSIAQAVLCYVADKKKLGAKSLFATHYHELCELEGKIDGVKNYNIAVKKRGDDITFLRKIVRGGADDSYGIEVAKLAGVPNEVTNHAKSILKKIESGEKNGRTELKSADISYETDPQISFSDTSAEEIKKIINDVDLNVLTPIEAMNMLYELKKKATL